MSAETTLNATLLADAGVSAIVGDRIYPDLSPQTAALPAVAYVRDRTEYAQSIDGTLHGQDAVLQIFCMAKGRAQAEQLADAVVLAVLPVWFVPTDRRSEFDPEAEVWAAVLVVSYFDHS